MKSEARSLKQDSNAIPSEYKASFNKLLAIGCWLLAEIAGSGKLEARSWKLEAGSWKLESDALPSEYKACCNKLLAIGCWLLAEIAGSWKLEA